jgi:hypothetical protein
MENPKRRSERALGMLSSHHSQLRIDWMYNTHSELCNIMYNSGQLNGETSFLVCNSFGNTAPRGPTQDVDLYVTSFSMTKNSSR